MCSLLPLRLGPGSDVARRSTPRLLLPLLLPTKDPLMIGTSRWRRTFATLLAVPLVAALGACASADDNSSSGDGAAAPAASQASNEKTAPELRLGYFANVTHATPLVGIQEGIYAKALGDPKVTTSIFNAAPVPTEAMTGNSIDAAYLGPNPAINGYVKSNGSLLR